MIKRIVKSIFSERFIEYSFSFFYKVQSFFNFIFNSLKFKQFKKKKKIIYIMTPSHRNIGDAAIVLGTYAFLKKKHPDLPIIEFTDKETQKNRYTINFIARDDDLIYIHGGGNLGDWYVSWELLRQQMIVLLKKKNVTVLPQTISFGNRSNTSWLLKRAKRVYSRNYFKTFICRDEKSYEFAKSNLGIKDPVLAPDTALILSRFKKNAPSKQIVVCLRQDIEKAVSIQEEKQIKDICSSFGYDVVVTDTIDANPIEKEKRTQVVLDKIELFNQSALVITDRYHGVIFSYLANVPCVAFGNKDHKLSEAMRFFGPFEYIRMVKSIDEMTTVIPALLNSDTSLSIDYYEKYFRNIS